MVILLAISITFLDIIMNLKIGFYIGISFFSNYLIFNFMILFQI